MAVIPEIARAETFLYARLSAELVIPVYAMPAPSTATMPYAVFDLLPESDTKTKRETVWTSLESVCRVVVQGSSTLADEHLAAIERAVGSASGDDISCRRIALFRLPPYFPEGSNQPVFESGLRVRVRIGG